MKFCTKRESHARTIAQLTVGREVTCPDIYLVSIFFQLAMSSHHTCTLARIIVNLVMTGVVLFIIAHAGVNWNGLTRA